MGASGRNRLLRWLSIAYGLGSPTCSAQIILPAPCGETYPWSADKTGDTIIKIDFCSCSVDSAEIEASLRKDLNESLSAGQRKKVKVVSLIGPESEENRHEVMAAWDYACSRAGGRSKRASSDDFLKIYRGSPVSRAIHGALSKNGMLFQVDG